MADRFLKEDGYNERFCAKLDSNGFGEYMGIWEIQGILFLFSAGFLFVWAREQYVRASDPYFSDQPVIFPLHRNMLVLVGLFYFLNTCLFALVKHNLLPYYSWIIMFALIDVVIATASIILLSSSIGRASIKKASCLGIIWGTLSFITDLIVADYHIFNNRPLEDVFVLFWEFFQFAFFAFVWLAPNNGQFFIRRYPAIYWARFRCYFRFFFTIANVLIYIDIDAGYCMFNLCITIFFAIFQCWVMYRTFVLEARWWHGIEDSDRNSDFWIYSFVHTTLVQLMFGRQASSGSGGDDVNDFQKTNPLRGMELSGSAAFAMSKVADNINKSAITFDTNEGSSESAQPGKSPRQKSIRFSTRPSNGSSLGGEEALPDHDTDDGASGGVEVAKRRPTLTAKAVRRFSSGMRSIVGGGSEQSHSDKKVPMINFTRLKISKVMLGAGSSARVYEGLWCGQKCAIKMLFTVDITAEEIKRSCLEAKLLHNLAGVSENIVKLYGVAVLPPSLCVVLEYCSEGALSDFLYTKHVIDMSQFTTFENVRNSISRNLRGSGTSGGGFLRNSFTLRNSSGGSKSNKGRRVSFMTAEDAPSSNSGANVSSMASSFTNALSSMGNFMDSSTAAIGPRDFEEASPGLPTKVSEVSEYNRAKNMSESEHVNKISWFDCLELALGAVRGLVGLQDVLPGFSHNDVKGANFLVNKVLMEERMDDFQTRSRRKSSRLKLLVTDKENKDKNGEVSAENAFDNIIYGSEYVKKNKKFRYIVKLADVEFASLGVTPEHMKGFETPANWVAPEILTNKCQVSPASDVFALGNVFYEIAYRQVPWDGVNNDTIRNNIIKGVLPDFPVLSSMHSLIGCQGEVPDARGVDVDPKLERERIEIEKESRGRFQNLMMRCMSTDAERRPSVYEIESQLRQEMLALAQDLSGTSV